MVAPVLATAGALPDEMAAPFSIDEIAECAVAALARSRFGLSAAGLGEALQAEGMLDRHISFGERSGSGWRPLSAWSGPAA